jgi:hypothetical protein
LTIRPVMSAAIVVVVVVALAGCGGSSGPSVSKFKTGFAADKAQFTKLGSDLGTSVENASTKSNTELAAAFAALSARATQQVAQLSKLDPPAKFKNDLDQLKMRFTAVATDLTSISTAATKGDPTAAKTATEKLVKDAAQVKTSDTALTSALGLPQTV